MSLSKLHNPLHDTGSDNVLIIEDKDENQFKIVKLIGSGLHGHVFLVTDIHDKLWAVKVVAAPVVNPEDVNSTNLVMRTEYKAKREIVFHTLNKKTIAEERINIVHVESEWCVENLTKQDYLAWNKSVRKSLNLKHDEVARKIKDFCQENWRINVHYIRMEYYPEGNLENWLLEHANNYAATYTIRLKFIEDILRAVRFLHKRGLIHRRLCLANILIKISTSTGRWEAVVAGLGCITSWGDNAAWRLRDGCNPLSRQGLQNNKDYTADYTAPELHGTEYNELCDMFSVGVIMLVLLRNLHHRNDLLDAKLKIQCEEALPDEWLHDPRSAFIIGLIKRQLSNKGYRLCSVCLFVKMEEVIHAQTWWPPRQQYMGTVDIMPHYDTDPEYCPGSLKAENERHIEDAINRNRLPRNAPLDSRRLGMSENAAVKQPMSDKQKDVLQQNMLAVVTALTSIESQAALLLNMNGFISNDQLAQINCNTSSVLAITRMHALLSILQTNGGGWDGLLLLLRKHCRSEWLADILQQEAAICRLYLGEFSILSHGAVAQQGQSERFLAGIGDRVKNVQPNLYNRILKEK